MLGAPPLLLSMAINLVGVNEWFQRLSPASRFVKVLDLSDSA